MKKYDGETIFERDLAKVSPFYQCSYEKIPDETITKNNLMKVGNKFVVRAKKRFADGILVTPTNLYIIECKYNDGSIKAHQKENIIRLNKISHRYYILRKKIKIVSNKPSTTYMIQDLIDNRFKTIYKTNKIEEIILWFKEMK